MPTARAQSVIDDYAFHNMFIHRIVDGVTNEESVLQLPFEHNCMNWILGHIVTNRSHVLETVSAAHAWQEEVPARCIKPGHRLSGLGVRQCSSKA